MMKTLLIAFCTVAPTSAFIAPKVSSDHSILASSFSDEPVGLVDLSTPVPSKKGPSMSQSIPFLKCNPHLDGELAGDVGFDPLNFAQNKEALWEYREAEIKHARLAMLAAAGWPMSELLDRNIADYFGLHSLLDDADRVPSLLNGGLESVPSVWWGFCLGLTAAIDSYGVQRARSAGYDSDYTPGDLGFDPLGLYPLDRQGQKEMQLKEMKNGRLAMVAVLAFSLQEYSSNLGVIDETPFFFYPITETAEKFLQDFVN